MTVDYDQPCVTLRFSSTSFPSSGGTGSIDVAAPQDCAWTASTTANWIALREPASGQGGGTVEFTVAESSGAQQRNGYIAVQRQSTKISQSGGGPSVVRLSPSAGTGESGQFTFYFEDPAGFADISQVTLTFTGQPAACQIVASPNSRTLNVSDGGSLSLSNSAAIATNTVCSISASGSSISGTGNELQVTVQVGFLPAFAGGHRITAAAKSSRATSATIPLGAWLVPTTARPSVTIQATLPSAPFSVDGDHVYQAPATFYWEAGSQHTVEWLASSPGQSSQTYTFQSWAHGGSNPRSITAPSSPAAYVATRGPRMGLLAQTLAGARSPTALPAVSGLAFSNALAADAKGNIYVVSFSMHALYKLDASGVLTRVAGLALPGTRATAAQLSALNCRVRMEWRSIRPAIGVPRMKTMDASAR